MAVSKGGFKIPEWATKIGLWAFMGVTTAGITVYMDTAANKQAIEVMQKTDDRQDAGIAQNAADIRALRESHDEVARKSSDKLDQLIVMLERRRK